VWPQGATQPAVAKKVNGVVTTSSPGPTPRLIRAFRIASVPLDAPMPNAAPEYSATAFSQAATLGPPMHRWD